jgi:hypothetical protein
VFWNLPLKRNIERKALLEPLLANKLGLQFNGHETGDGELSTPANSGSRA